jgi:hypothetical protein
LLSSDKCNVVSIHLHYKQVVVAHLLAAMGRVSYWMTIYCECHILLLIYLAELLALLLFAQVNEIHVFLYLTKPNRYLRFSLLCCRELFQYQYVCTVKKISTLPIDHDHVLIPQISIIVGELSFQAMTGSMKKHSLMMTRLWISTQRNVLI